MCIVATSSTGLQRFQRRSCVVVPLDLLVFFSSKIDALWPGPPWIRLVTVTIPAPILRCHPQSGIAMLCARGETRQKFMNFVACDGTTSWAVGASTCARMRMRVHLLLLPCSLVVQWDVAVRLHVCVHVRVFTVWCACLSVSMFHGDISVSRCLVPFLLRAVLRRWFLIVVCMVSCLVRVLRLFCVWRNPSESCSQVHSRRSSLCECNSGSGSNLMHCFLICY